jgi:hypothetical protein
MYVLPSKSNGLVVLLLIGTYFYPLISITWVGLFGLATTGSVGLGLVMTLALKAG